MKLGTKHSTQSVMGTYFLRFASARRSQMSSSDISLSTLLVFSGNALGTLQRTGDFF